MTNKISSLFLFTLSVSLGAGTESSQPVLQRASILQTQIVPYIQSEDSGQQIQSTQEQLAETQTQLEQTQTQLESTQEQLTQAQSEIESLIETCGSCVDTECLSQLESVQDELVVTQASYLDSLSTIDALEQQASALEPISSLIDAVDTCDAEIEAVNASTAEILQSVESIIDSLASCESQLDIVEESLRDALQDLSVVGRVTKIATGSYHTVLLLENGSIWAAGNNEYGQLGTGDTLDRAAFTPMLTDPSALFIDIAAAGDFEAVGSYSHTLALKNDGTVWATGSNTQGQLGIGTTNRQLTLTIMTENNDTIIAIAAGAYHSLVLKNDGTVWATGSNQFGQLGIDSLATKTLVLTKMAGENSAISTISGGAAHTLVLKNDGTVWATGNNQFGQLGLDSLETQTLVLTKMAGENSAISTISAGSLHSLVLKNDGTVWATGNNQSGQLGIGSTDQQLTLTPMTDFNSSVTALAAGGNHSLVLKNDGTVWATGDNQAGQLARGFINNDPNTTLDTTTRIYHK